MEQFHVSQTKASLGLALYVLGCKLCAVSKYDNTTESNLVNL